MTVRRLFLLLLLVGLALLPSGESLAVPPALSMPDQKSLAIGQDQLHDISEPVPLPDRSRPIVLAAAGLAAALLLAGLARAWLRWRRSSQRPVVLQAHEAALRLLSEAEKMIDAGQAAAFVALIDQALRRYLEARFGVSAPRLTTREFIAQLADSRSDAATELKSRSNSLKTWLECCDRVKFAGAEMSRQSMAEMTAELRKFVQSTSSKEERA